MVVESTKPIVGEEFVYSFPYGYWAEPQIKVLNGVYKGLIFDVMMSGLGRQPPETEFKFTYSYKILKMWDGVDTTKFDGVNITLDQKDVWFLGQLILSLIEDFNERRCS